MGKEYLDLDDYLNLNLGDLKNRKILINEKNMKLVNKLIDIVEEKED